MKENKTESNKEKKESILRYNVEFHTTINKKVTFRILEFYLLCLVTYLEREREKVEKGHIHTKTLRTFPLFPYIFLFFFSSL